MLLPERPDIVRQNQYKMIAGWQEQLLTTTPERNVPAPACSLSSRSVDSQPPGPVSAIDARLLKYVAMPAKIITGNTHRDQRRHCTDERIQPGPLRHVRPDRSAEQVGICSGRRTGLRRSPVSRFDHRRVVDQSSRSYG